jgi:hypothetical protein
MDTHLFGDNPDAATDRNTRRDAYRAKHRDEIQDDNA